MYLKSIEIQGFKSFPNKTVLTFGHGVTCIVGPNGSGKSNISDALRWVLGEQRSKSLRGFEMSDVIFSGTEFKRPQGFAYVAITLDNSDRYLNSDYREITVARRLYRSGESSYLINGIESRLRNVEELFFDSGIGREGYSIIGQGRVEAILNGRPEERRGIFDEAAGIVKFKQRKKEAERKLSAEQKNLERVSDILRELSDIVAPLGSQREAALRYLALRDEMKKLDLNIFVREEASAIKDIEKLEGDAEIILGAVEELKAEKERLSGTSTALSEKKAAVDADLSAKKADEAKAELLIENLTGQIHVLEARAKALSESGERFGGDIGRLRNEENLLSKNAADIFSELMDLRKALRSMAGSGEVSDGDVETLLLRTEKFGDRLRGAFGDAVFGEDTGEAGGDIGSKGTGTSARAAGEATESGIGKAADSEADEDGGEEDIRLPDWLQNIAGMRNDLELIREREEKNLSWQKTASDEFNALTLKLKALQEKYSARQRDYLSKKAGYESALNIAERYEGFGEAVRNCMDMKDTFPGIRGVAADILRVSKKYELAAEAALGGRIQNIVIDTERHARDLIGYLKKERKGRVTLLPLDTVSGKVHPDTISASKEPLALGLMSELVDFDEEYRGAADYLLGSTVAAENMEKASRLAARYRYTLRIVTLDGELLTPGGAITGGAYKNKLSLMGRRNRVEELSEETHRARAALAETKGEIEALENEVSEKNAELDRINRALAEIDREKQALSLTILSDMKIKLSELSQRADFVEENIERIIHSYETNRDRIAELSGSRDEAAREIEDVRGEIELRKADISHVEEGLKGLRAGIRSLEDEKEALSGEQDTLLRREEIDTEMLELEKDRLRIESGLEKKKEKLDLDMGYILNEYGASAEDARHSFEEGLGSLRVLKTRAKEIEEEIETLGPINIQAIDEYRKVADRYEFLLGQQEDLVKSADEITEAISKLNKEMRRIFREKFSEIDMEFNRVFGELFSGGEAHLQIAEGTEGGSDILDAGINISAQPPGKKLKNILQLSGGERALTAIAILFAIQNMKPSPFCVLDEIEAALDDTNVARFVRYLKKLSDDTEFIVITHKRGTMEAADRLYGVTMQERGISKLVSVDLSEAGVSR